MFFYKRKTSFIAYYINGVKSRNIGVVKQCLKEDGLELSVDLFGPEAWISMQCPVSVGNTKERKLIFEMDVRNGRGKGECCLPMRELQPLNASKIFFDLGTDCYGVADLCEMPAESVTAKELPDDDFVPQPDKWEVMKKKYPILYPFRGQGPYVSIKPVDLQLLDSKYHHLSNNSFLMHNFYQYKHLILGEYAWEKGNFFYVGVPGEFVKKEQNTAAMFGFEGYEHSGDLGYYLYRVSL